MRTKLQVKAVESKQERSEIGAVSPSLHVRRHTDVKICSPKIDKIRSKEHCETPKEGNKPKEFAVNLVSCKSFPNIFINNGYIKLQDSQPQGFELIRSKFEKSLLKTKLSGGLEETAKKKYSRNGQLPEDTGPKKGKFKRRNTFKLEGEVEIGNSCDSSLGNAELVNENINLKQRILEQDQKIEELTSQIQKLNPKALQQKTKSLEKSLKQYQLKLTQKDRQIQTLTKKIEQSEQQKKTITKKLQDMIQQQQVLKGSACSGFGLQLENDHSGIGMDMLSTAEYIESLTDLEDELHHKKTEIFDLNKAIEQMKIKHHFTELRHEENLRRVTEEWSNKYKRLLNMYKTAKAVRLAADNNNRMKKLKTKTEFIDQEKEDLFNLSLSTDRSQLPYYSN